MPKVHYLILFISLTINISYTLFARNCKPNNSTSLKGVLVDSVSVDLTTQKAIIGWRNTSNQDIVRFYIRKKNILTGHDVTIDSVDANKKPLTYIYNLSKTPKESEQYALGFRDSCDNVMQTILDYHSTMFLSSKIDTCKMLVMLKWNPYTYFKSSGRVIYNIFLKSGNGIFKKIGTTYSTNFNYKITNTRDKNIFLVRAVENNGSGPFSSSSNTDTINEVFYKTPLKTKIYNLTLDKSNLEDYKNQNNHITIGIEIDTSAEVMQYILKKRTINSNTNNLEYKEIKRFNHSTTNSEIIFDDYDVDVLNERYEYFLEVINPCNLVIEITLGLKTISLFTKIKNQYRGLNSITFTNLSKLDSNTEITYFLFRKAIGSNIEQISNIVSLKNYKDTILNFEDIIQSDKLISGRYCYQIKAVETNSNKNYKFNSYSNISCIEYQSTCFIPNAFRISSIFNNNIFKPLCNTKNMTEYSFKIFNRNGSKIFETKNLEEGWDGKNKITGKKETESQKTYVYVIEYREGLTKDVVRKIGTVIMLE